MLKLDKITDFEPFLKLMEAKGLGIKQVIRPEKREAYVIGVSDQD